MFRNVLASVSAAILVLAPLSAQAGTRAASAGVSMSALAQARAAAPVGAAEYQGAEEAGGIPMWALIAMFLAAGTGIILGIESGENNKSPGT